MDDVDRFTVLAVAVKMLIEQTRTDIQPVCIDDLAVLRNADIAGGNDPVAVDQNDAVRDAVRENELTVYDGFHVRFSF